MRTLGVFLNVRKGGQRCPNKVLRPFCGTTLFDIAIKKLNDLHANEKIVAAYDDDFKCIYDDVANDTVQFFQRTYESVSIDLPLTTVYQCLNHMTSDYVMFMNASHAHVTAGTLQKAIDYFCGGDFESMTSVVRIKDWLFNSKGEVMVEIGDGNTKNTPSSYRVAHVFHCWNRQRFIDTGGTLWTGSLDDPHLFEVNRDEAVDIDGERDFLLSEWLYGRR